MPGMIEHGLATAFGFVTKPVGAAITVAALSAIVGGGLWAKNWWAGIEAKDDTIESLNGQVTTLTVDLRTAQLDAANARIAFQRREADLQNQVQVASGEAAQQRQRAVRLAARIEELRHEETGPLAPVLVRALDGVRDDLRGFTPVA